MRIVIASPPKSGNHWLKCLLAHAYGLDQVGEEGKFRLVRDPATGLRIEGVMPDGSIVHAHHKCSSRFCALIEQIPAHLVSIVRNPYDVFVSLYFWTQERNDREKEGNSARSRNTMHGKPLDHPDVLAYLATEFEGSLQRAEGWLAGGRAPVVRYEGLHADPVAELQRVAARIHPIPRDRMDAAITACHADRLRQRGKKMAWHVRSAKVGDSYDKLGEAHYAIFRERYAHLIRSLGYEVR